MSFWQHCLRSTSLRAALGILLFSSFPAAAISDPAGTSATPTPRLRYRIIVNEGKWFQIKTPQWSLSPEVAAAMQDELIEKLQRSGWFIVVVRDDSDASDKDRANADFVITPTNVDYSETSVSKKGFNIGDVRVGGDFGQAQATLTMQISDARTDEFMDLETSTGKAHIKSNSEESGLIGIAFTNARFQATPAGKSVALAMDAAVEKASARISKEPWSALVADQDDTTGRVVIDAGDMAGVEPGELFDIYEPGKPVVDPVTGATISQGDETLVGRIRVVRTERYAAYCDVVNGDKFDVKDIVKPAS